MMSRRGKSFLWAAAVLAAVYVIPSSRLWVEARGDYFEGRAALEAGERKAAQVRFEQAARAYFPGNRYGKMALEGLEEISAAWEREGEVLHALSAAESFRGNLFATAARRRLPGAISRADERVGRLREAFGEAYPPATGWASGGAPEAASTLVRKREPAGSRALPGVILLLASLLPVWRLAGIWGIPGPGKRGAFSCGMALALMAAGLLLLSLA